MCVELPVNLDGAPVHSGGAIRRGVDGKDAFLVGLQIDDLDQRHRAPLAQLLGPDGLAADPLVIPDNSEDGRMRGCGIYLLENGLNAHV